MTSLLPAILLGASLAVPAPELLRSLGPSLVKLESPRGGSLFPHDLSIAVREERGRLVAVLQGSFERVPDEVVEELRRETLLGALSALNAETGVDWRVRGPDGRERPLGVDVPELPVSLRRVPGAAQKLRRIAGTGALAGKRIAISAGHGWLGATGGGWRTQRARWDFDGCGNCRGIVEDFYSAEIVTNVLVPLLQGMGAEVVLVREPDAALETTIVDDGEQGYTDTGFAVGDSGGGWNGDYRASEAGDATATFFPAFANPGPRRVGLRWREGTNRTDAVVEVRHAGGSTFFDLDQRGMGTLFLDLGAFWFGSSGASVVLANGGTGFLVADALKFGGGTHTSGKPWWQMGAESYVPWSGAPASVTQYGDVSIRPAFAEYAQADAYVSLHGNASGTAGGSTATGTSVYRYSCQQYGDHTRSDLATGCDDPPGSRALEDAIHGAVLARIRGEWDVNWKDRGRLVANFGELRTLDTTPGVLIEAAFFDNIANPAGTPPPKYADNRSMHDPRWRESLAYGIAEGLAKYFNANAGAPPQRPDGLVARNTAEGALELTWTPVAGATSYRVFVAENPVAGRNRAWNAGVVVNEPRLVLADFAPRTFVALRVVAVNAQGEGLPSQAVVARVRGARNVPGRRTQVLHVMAYDRRDAWVQDVDNDLSHAIEHGQAFAGIVPNDLYFDGTLDEAVEQDRVALSDYALVDVQAGKDSSEHASLSRPLQERLRAFVAAGGAAIVSGEEIGYHLASRSTDAADRAFFGEVLGADYVADDAETYDLAGASGSAFEGLSLRLDDGTAGVYAVVYPDVIAAKTGASLALTYPNGTGAAVLQGRVLYVAAPIEAIVPASSRAAFMGRALSVLLPDLGSGDLDGDGASDECEIGEGLDWRDGADGVLDTDDDGVSNADECRAGTDPTGDPIIPDAGPRPDAGGVVRDAGHVVATPDAGVTAEPQLLVARAGCGCSGTPVEAWWLLVGLVAIRRRR